MKKFLILPVLFLCACTAGAMSTDEIKQVQANCSNVDQQIAVLEKEEKDHDKRVAAGAGDILPVTAVARLIGGSYDTNRKIASGEWAALIDKKLAELRQLKSNCMQQYY